MVSRRPWSLLPLTLSFAAGLLATGAQSQVARDTTLNAPTTEYFVAPAAAFRSNNDVSYGDYLDFDPVQGSVSGRGCAYAPADLPQGATVSSLVIWVLDNDAGGGVTVDLRRRAATGADAAFAMASTFSSADSPSVTPYVDFSVSNAVVDNDNYTYFLVRCDLGTDPGLRRFYSASVGYTR